MKGRDVRATLLTCCYAETLEREGLPASRVKFLQSLDTGTPPTRTLIATLIRAPRFATLDWSSLKAMLAMINAWTKAPVVDPQEIQNLRHPYGEQHAVQQPEQAAQTYPEQTKALNATLDHWRERIKASVADWSKQ